MSNSTLEPVFEGSRLKALRFERGLSAEEAARRSDVSLRHLLRLEAGQRPNTSAVTLFRIAQALNTTVEYLLRAASDSRSIHELIARCTMSAGGQWDQAMGAHGGDQTFRPVKLAQEQSTRAL